MGLLVVNDTMPSHVPILQEMNEVKVADQRYVSQESPIKIVKRASTEQHTIRRAPERGGKGIMGTSPPERAPSYPHSKDSASMKKHQSLASLLIVRTLPNYASSMGESVSNYPNSLLTSSFNFNMQRFDDILARTQQVRSKWLLFLCC
jgi:hypothetical protein